MKTLSALLRGETSNHNGDFYCLNCFHSYSTKEKLKKHERVCNDHDYCYVEMSNEEKKYKNTTMKKKCAHVKIILKNLIQRKKLSMHLLVTHFLQVLHLIQQKISLIVTEGKTVWKGFVKV